MTIAGFLTDAPAAAHNIVKKMSKCGNNLTWYVWHSGTTVNICSDISKTVVPESDLIGTYCWRRSVESRPTESQIEDDLKAAYDEMFVSLFSEVN